MRTSGTEAPRYLSDVGTVGVAAATWVGVWLARPLPLAAGVAAVVAAFAFRRPLLLAAGGLALGSSLGAAAWSGLIPVSEGAYEGSVLLVTDPSGASGEVRADAKLDDGRRVELTARGGVSRSIQEVLAGERLAVRGQLEPAPPEATWLAVRHVVGRIEVSSVTSAPVSNDVAAGIANHYRRILTSGAYALPAAQRPLFLGFVLGDDRGQDPAAVDDFRGSGLSHLLVVSGQNVAFFLVLARPMLDRLPMAGRLAATLVLLGWFAMLTRFEPSVLRATAMAGISALALFSGQRAAPVRTLSLAVAGLLLIDPMLGSSIGFGMSVGASAGMVLLSLPIAGALPGPAAMREALAVTLAAQAGVAPFMIAAFGGLPVVSPVANVAAVPAAGPVMVWGLTAGTAAGLLGPVAGGAVSRLVHLPTRALLWWVSAVAQAAAGAPIGVLTGVPCALLAGSLALFVWSRKAARSSDPRVTTRRLEAVSAAMIVILVMVPAVAMRASTNEVAVLATGVTMWRSGQTVVVVVNQSDARAMDLLAGIRRRGISRVDLYVSASGGLAAAELLDTLRSRVTVTQVWQPVNGTLTAARTPVAGRTYPVGDLTVEAREVDPRLVVEVGPMTARR